MPTQNVQRRSTTHGDLLSSVPKIDRSAICDVTGPDDWGPPSEWAQRDNDGDDNRFVLSQNQRSLLLTGVASNNRSSKNEAILRKRDLIPERVQHLVDDLALLYNQELLSEDSWEYGLIEEEAVQNVRTNLHDKLNEVESDAVSAGEPDGEYSQETGDEYYTEIDRYETPYDSPEDWWSDLTEITRRSTAVSDKTVLLTGAEASETIQFGLELGNLLRMLHPGDDSSKQVDLLWGFVLAFAGADESDSADEIERLQTIISDLQEESERYITEVQQMNSADQMLEERMEKHEEARKEGIKEAGITPLDLILREVDYHSPTGKTESEQYDRSRRIARTITNDIIDATPLEKIEALCETLRGDLEVIHQKGASGVTSVAEVIEGLGKTIQADENVAETASTQSEESREKDNTHYGKSSSENISKEVDHQKSIITENLNRLSAKDEMTCWTKEPVVEEKSSSTQGHEWEMTDYGKLLWCCAKKDGETDDGKESKSDNQDGQKRTAWIYRYALGPEDLSLRERKLISDTLDELDMIDNPDPSDVR